MLFFIMQFFFKWIWKIMDNSDKMVETVTLEHWYLDSFSLLKNYTKC